MWTAENYLSRAVRRRLEDLSLHFTRQIRIYWRDDQLRYLITESIHGLFEVLFCSLDLVLTGEKEENVALRLGSMYLEDGCDRSVDIVGFGLLGVEHIDREASTGN